MDTKNSAPLFVPQGFAGLLCKSLLILFMSSVFSIGHAIVCYSDAAETTPTSAFSINNDGTVSDNRTGLMWSACAQGQTWSAGSCTGTESNYTWSAALQSAVDANTAAYLGYTDWRLPNRTELASILELSCVNPAINIVLFPDAPNATFWTSTPTSYNSERSWRVVFNFGNVTLSPRTDSLAVRLVRN